MSGFAFRIGDKRIAGEVNTKAQARHAIRSKSRPAEAFAPVTKVDRDFACQRAQLLAMRFSNQLLETLNHRIA